MVFAIILMWACCEFDFCSSIDALSIVLCIFQIINVCIYDPSFQIHCADFLPQCFFMFPSSKEVLNVYTSQCIWSLFFQFRCGHPSKFLTSAYMIHRFKSSIYANGFCHNIRWTHIIFSCIEDYALLGYLCVCVPSGASFFSSFCAGIRLCLEYFGTFLTFC